MSSPSPTVKTRLLELGIEARASSPEEIQARLKSDIDKWRKVIEKSGIEQAIEGSHGSGVGPVTMNLKQLEYFVQVAELGSFSKAAVVLDIAQPALSRQVRALETELHQQLFLRNGRGVALTDAGKRLFDHSVAVLQLVSHAREDLGASRDEPVGRVTIGLPPSIGRQFTLPLIDRFKKELPAARLAIVEGLSSHIVEWVTTGRVDVGLVYNPEAQPGWRSCRCCRKQLGLVSLAPKGKRQGDRAAADEGAVALSADRAGARPCHAAPAGDPGGAGRRQARYRLGGVERSLDHRTGLRRLWPRGADRQRRGGVDARGRSRDPPAGRSDRRPACCASRPRRTSGRRR